MTVITSTFGIYAWNFRRVRNSVLSGLMSVTGQISDFGPLISDFRGDPNLCTPVCTHTCTDDPETFGVRHRYLVLITNPNLYVWHFCVQREFKFLFSKKLIRMCIRINSAPKLKLEAQVTHRCATHANLGLQQVLSTYDTQRKFQGHMSPHVRTRQ